MKPIMEAMNKALLLEAGMIYLQDHNLLSQTERPTAGPDGGLRGIFLKFGRHRIRMAVTQKRDETPFQLKMVDDGYLIMKRGSKFIRNVTVEKPTIHAPKQAFINLASPCIFDCKFCATPKLRVRFVLEPKRVLALIKSAMRSSERVEAIALTSGVIGSERKIIKLMSDTVKLIRKEVGKHIPIGVEPYVTAKGYIDELFSSGANEIKVNVESFDRRIMKAVCPNVEYDKVLSVLEYSTSVFGKNRVCSNVIMGLGETNENILNGLKWMAERGIVANLRPLFISPYRRLDIAEATSNKASRPSATRILKLALTYQSILEKHDLKTFMFQTMCFKCTGCEITPQQDV